MIACTSCLGAYPQVTVPTAETASATFWMEQRMAMGKAVMLVGPAGTGKTQLVMGALRSLMERPGIDYMTSKVNMNFYTRYKVYQGASRIKGTLPWDRHSVRVLEPPLKPSNRWNDGLYINCLLTLANDSCCLRYLVTLHTCWH